MPHYSSRRPSTKRDHPMPRVFEEMVYKQPAGYFTFDDAHRERSRHHDDSHRHDAHSNSRRDSYSHGFRHVPSTAPCCSPDRPHPLRDLDMGDLAYHYFERMPGIRTCCSPENPHPFHDLGMGDLAYHYFEKISSAIPRQRETDHDKDQPYNGSGRFSYRTSGARSTKDRESKYQPDTSADFTFHERETYYSDKHQDSSHYPQPQRSEHRPHRASSIQKQSHTSRSAQTKVSESRRESASGRKPAASSNRRESSTHDHAKPESKAKSSRSHHHDRYEYDSKHERSHNYPHGNNRKEDRQSREQHREDRHHKSSAPPSQPETIFPDHYKTLGISSKASTDEIKKAARSMRVSSHPDKLKKPEMSESELKQIDERAALVGQAADVLQNRDLKESYDLKRAARGF